MSSSRSVYLTKSLIPLEEILLATKNFSSETLIARGGYATVHRGQLSERWQNRTAAVKRLYNNHSNRNKFHNELQMVFHFQHQNIIDFIGYCYEASEMIIVLEYASNRSLDHHLQDPTNRGLTWAQRLKICIGTARGLEYIHSGPRGGRIVIHNNIKGKNILLDHNLEAKICDFSLSEFGPRADQQMVPSNSLHAGGQTVRKTPFIDSDVYEFGKLLFIILCGMPTYESRISDAEHKTFKHWVRRHTIDGLENLIDPQIKYEININSFHVFMEIAYQCVSESLEDRPKMSKIIERIQEALDIQNHGEAFSITTQSFKSFLIPLKEINLATRDFSSETRIGDGGFGVVYRGQLSEHWQNCKVAIKRRDLRGYQGKNEFLTELKLISRFHHENIIPLIGYCDEGTEMIIVYEYASNRSLDYHLQDPNKRSCLTWAQRLRICLGAARGLNYLHSGLGEDNRVIHRDIKSGNILLDENLVAKICDFGLSKEGPRNQQSTQVYTKAAGTNFYMDPVYHESGILRKESDVYSFGVVLFEMLSGMLAYNLRSIGDGSPQPLISLVRRYYKDGLDNLIDPLIRDQIDSHSFDMFKELAYECISYQLDKRPTMDNIIERINDALDFLASPCI